MKDAFCAQCGQVLPTGSLKYLVHIKIVPDFGDFILHSVKNPFDELQGLFNEMEGADNQELDDNEYKEISLHLCEKCKNRLTRDSFSSKEGSFFSNKDLDKSFH